MKPRSTNQFLLSFPGCTKRQHRNVHWDKFCGIGLGVISMIFGTLQAEDLPQSVIQLETISDPIVTPMCHSSTLVQLKEGLLAGWFGGSAERVPDVSIWVSRKESQEWSKPLKIAEGTEDGPERFACWNPVLFQPKTGPLYLYYKVGKNPETWWGRWKTSKDGGKTWSKSTRLPRDFIGPVRNKPLEVEEGILLCGSSTESDGWRVHMERVHLRTQGWKRTGDLNDAMEWAAIQPTILDWPGDMQILCRSKQGVVLQGWSEDNGKTWGPLRRTTIPNPNSALDAVMLKDGRALIAHNRSAEGRHSLDISLSKDANNWELATTVETADGEVCYPAVIQDLDGMVHVTYSWNRQVIRHAILDPRQLKLKM